MKSTILYTDKTMNILKLYNTVGKQIIDRTIELLNPYSISDENIGGGKSGLISNPTESAAILLCEDEFLNALYLIENGVDKVSRYYRYKPFDFDTFMNMLDHELTLPEVASKHEQG